MRSPTQLTFNAAESPLCAHDIRRAALWGVVQGYLGRMTITMAEEGKLLTLTASVPTVDAVSPTTIK